jgi:hypothetical protein
MPHAGGLLVRRLAAALLLVVLTHAASAQQAAPREVESVAEIAQCLLQGLPDDWLRAVMEVTLKAPGDSTGAVRYGVARQGAEGELEDFSPCDTRRPAAVLVAMRAHQAAERRGWTTARLTLERDGSFRLDYDFPK